MNDLTMNNNQSPITLEFGAQTQNAAQPPDALTPADPPALSIDSLSPAEQQTVRDFAAKINITDSAAIMEYGVAAQNKIAQFSDSVLQNVKTKDTGEIGKSLSNLVVEIKNVDSDGSEKGGLFGLRKAAANIGKQLEKMSANYSKAETNVDKITSVLNGHQRALLKDIATLDIMYENNLSYFKELSMYIIAGEQRLTEYNAADIPKQRELAQRTGDEMESQKLNDMVSNASRFEKKLHDLKISRVISIQMAPQIRLIQNNDKTLSDKIQSSIVNAIPLWKNQMVIALALTTGKAALSAQKKVSDMTNEMLVKNSEMLKQGSVEIAKESERSIVSIETVRKTNENLISTINEVLSVQQKGREDRAAAETELIKIEDSLKQTLAGVGNK